MSEPAVLIEWGEDDSRIPAARKAVSKMYHTVHVWSIRGADHQVSNISAERCCKPLFGK
jgi:hypothetical protein